jgi:thioredoxin reductase
MHDVVIIGGGPAGLSGALVLARARRRVMVIDEGRPRNADAAGVHGFLARDGHPPGKLLATGRKEVTRYGATVITGTVSAAQSTPPGFTVFLHDGLRFQTRQLRARRLLVATGLRDQLPDLPGLPERWGRDVHGCPYCHGWEVRDTPLAVLGTGGLSVRQALLLTQWSDQVTYLPHLAGEPDRTEQTQLTRRGVRTVAGMVTRLVTDRVTGHRRLTGLELADGTVVTCTSLFLTPRFVPNNTVLTNLGCAMSPDGWVRVDASGRTSLSGVWAAGNITGTGIQVISAAGAGATAATALNADLLDDELNNELAYNLSS